MKTKTIEKLAFITGATSGIGKACAKIFAKNGYNLIITGRRIDRLEENKQKLENKYSVNVQSLQYDIRNYSECEKAIKSLSAGQQQVDVLVNNAGLAKGKSPIHKGDIEHWETMIDTNVKGLLYMTRLISPTMVKNKKGHIINVCSSAGHEVYPSGNVYCATKHAVDAITSSSRMDLFKHNIRVSQVSPGHVEETEFAKVRFDGDLEKSNIYSEFNPLKSKDVANIVYFIASQPFHVTIQDVIVMGTQQCNNIFVDTSGRKF
jgi:NADP-dependent 3-hydroxy acid dehydrogenase YdfG